MLALEIVRVEPVLLFDTVPLAIDVPARFREVAYFTFISTSVPDLITPLISDTIKALFAYNNVCSSFGCGVRNTKPLGEIVPRDPV